MTNISINFITNAILNIVLLGILISLISRNNILQEKVAKAYKLTSVLTISVIIAEVLTVVFDQGGSSFRWPNIIANITGFTLSTCIPIALSMVFDTTGGKTRRWLSIPAVINGGLWIISPWTGWMFFVTPDNIYKRGPLFFIYIIIYIWAGMLLILAIKKSIVSYQNENKSFITMLIWIFFGGTLMQVVFPIVHTAWYGITIILVAQYIFICELKYRFDITTGLLNRQAFEKKLQMLEREGEATIILFDVNKFKQINDTYGHQKGDYYLSEVAKYIRNAFESIGKSYRIGGDEFCVLARTTEPQNIEKCIIDLKMKMATDRKSDPILPVVAYGYRRFLKDEGKTILVVMKEADEALYRQKHGTSEQVLQNTCDNE